VTADQTFVIDSAGLAGAKAAETLRKEGFEGRVVVVGAEVAASARQRGLAVTVISPHTVPLRRVLGSEVGGVYRDIHSERGVMMLGSAVEAFEGDVSLEQLAPNDRRAAA